jgi:hypothetical protein
MKTRASGYWERVRDKAGEIGSDGCTGAGAVFRDCCFEHDIHYRTGRTLDGQPITKAQADDRFRACMQARSVLGWWSPMAWIRWSAVRLFGRFGSTGATNELQELRQFDRTLEQLQQKAKRQRRPKVGKDVGRPHDTD